MFGYQPNQILGRHVGVIIPQATRAFGKQSGAQQVGAANADLWNLGPELMGVRSDQAVFPIELSVTPMQLAGRTMFTGVIRDISDRKEVEKRIYDMAHHDHLTGLTNRAFFSTKLSAELQRAERSNRKIALLMLDLDRFKEVNDTLGHGTGDKLLEAVAARLRNIVHSHHNLARLGGDEFAIACFDFDKRQAESLAKRIMFELDSRIEIEKRKISTGTSIGIAIYPQDAGTSEDLLRNADLALYRAKAEGRGTYAFFNEELARIVSEKRVLEEELRLAIAGSELSVHYQPKIETVSNRVVSAEALVRWQHPERGCISAGEFVPLAEERGLIAQIGERVLFKACHQGAKWPNIGIAVNLSPAQFLCDDVVRLVKSAIKSSSIVPKQLTLEITEGLLLQQDRNIIDQLHDLKSLGVRLSLDDFGTGYSSLSYLSSLPFDELKIDRSFIMQLDSERGANIVRAVISLANSLGLRIVGEGVETQKQLDFLRKHGCHYIQGYLIGKPVDAEAFSKQIPSDLRKSAA